MPASVDEHQRALEAHAAELQDGLAERIGDGRIVRVERRAERVRRSIAGFTGAQRRNGPDDFGYVHLAGQLNIF